MQDAGADASTPTDVETDAGEEIDAGDVDAGPEPTDGGHLVCSLGDKRCNQDKTAVELCVGDSWKVFQTGYEFPR